MGGPMGVYDDAQYPWLAAEKEHIRAAIDAGKAVLGICLGAQLIAASLGAEVLPHTHKEIGWFPVSMTAAGVAHPLFAGINPAMTVFHWHGDRFDIPAGAQHLMSSTGCDNQAFAYGEKVLALQFHLEMDVAAVEGLIGACGRELKQGAWIQNADWLVQLAESGKTRLALFALLDNWAAA
jgi:GMP synthase-like glutamine amidotransferase